MNAFRGDEKTTSTAGWKVLCAGQSVATAPRLFGRMRRHHLGWASLSAPEPADKMTQPIEIDIDHRRGVERQQLRDQQAADDGIAERLAELGGGPRAAPHSDRRREA